MYDFYVLLEGLCFFILMYLLINESRCNILIILLKFLVNVFEGMMFCRKEIVLFVFFMGLYCVYY